MVNYYYVLEISDDEKTFKICTVRMVMHMEVITVFYGFQDILIYSISQQACKVIHTRFHASYYLTLL